MKKNILLSLCMVMAVTAVMTSCKKDHDFISIRATISDYRDTGKDGKTYIETIDDVDWVSWNNNDKVWINNTAYNVTVSNESTSSRYATFERVTYVDPADASRDGYYAVYPASQVVSSPTNGFPQILLPQVQIYRTDNSGNQIIDAPMAAYCQASRTHVGLDFTNLCSLLKIELTSPMEVACIEVTNTNAALWGDATISGPTSGNADPTLTLTTYTDDEHKTVTLDFRNSNPRVNSQGPFYVVLPGNIQLRNLTINVYTYKSTSSSDIIKRFTKSAGNSEVEVSLSPNYIYTYSTGDQGTFDSEQGLGIGEFSVGVGKKVRFSTGNLQYQASTGTWRFAENQWDHIGNTVGNTTSIDDGRSTQTYWIDLFGYGTSGYNNHFPWQTTTTYNQTTNYATGDIYNTNNDWGVNPISNGGNQPNKWRTLTSEEWQYLTNVNNNTSSNYPRYRKQGLAKITVESTTYYGFVLMPDDYTPPTSISDKVSSNWTNPSGFCEFNAAEWTTLSNNGCVFLPCSGRRNNLVWQANADGSNRKDGFYWTSTSDGSSNAKYFRLSCTNNSTGGTTSCMSESSYMGLAVRLVRDVD